MRGEPANRFKNSLSDFIARSFLSEILSPARGLRNSGWGVIFCFAML